MKRILLFLVLIQLLPACKSKYQRILERELASGQRQDTLFFGLSLGMTKKQFFEICWDMNKSGEMTQGPMNLSARYLLNKGLKAPAYLDFYPNFNADTIAEMPALFSYKDWAPWNKSLSLDSLMIDVKSLMHQWYGEGFFEIKKTGRPTLYLQIKGNRRVRLERLEPNQVKMVITDMTHPFLLPSVDSLNIQ